MTPLPSRRPSPVGLVAIVGLLAAAVATALPWFTLDQAGVDRVAAAAAAQGKMAGMTAKEAFISDNVSVIAAALRDTLTGHAIDGTAWFIGRLVALGAGLFLVLQLRGVIAGAVNGMVVAAAFAVMAGVFAWRPLMHLSAPPSLRFAEALSPAPGLYLSLLGGVLMLAAAVLLRASSGRSA